MMSRFLLGLVMCLSLAIVGTSIPHEAMAKSKRSKKAPKADPKNELIIKALGPLKWGMTKDQVVEALRDEEMDATRQNVELRRDRLQMQQAMKRIREHSKKFADTYTELKGRTNLDVSVIGDEFIKDHNEAYLRIVDSRSQRYYFFYRNALYKYVVAYNKSYLENVDFEGFIAATIAKYGRPTEAKYDEDSDDDTIKSVEWVTKNVLLVLKNKQKFFGTYTMTFADPRIYNSWIKMREAKDRLANNSTRVSSEVKGLLQTGEVRSNDSVVSNLVGRTNIDMTNIIPKRQAEREAEEAAAREAKKKKEEEERKKKAKKYRDRKKRRKGKKPKFDFSDIDSNKSGEGLIIY